MNERATVVKWFQQALYAWVSLFLFSCLFQSQWLWIDPISPNLPLVGSVGEWFVMPFNTWLPAWAVWPAVILVMLLSLWSIFRRPMIWSSILIWVLFNGMVHIAWLANSAGQYLVTNMLFWSIFMCPGDRRKDDALTIRVIGNSLGLWAVRIQILIVYSATVAHKLMGTTWIHGKAMGIVASDQASSMGLLNDQPWLLAMMTWAALLFQGSFTLLIWWRRFRPFLFTIGATFHLLTALFLDLPDMAFAFLVAYVAWLDEDHIPLILQRWKRLWV